MASPLHSRGLLMWTVLRTASHGIALSVRPVQGGFVRRTDHITSHYSAILIECKQAPSPDRYVGERAYGENEGPQASPRRFSRWVRELGQRAAELGPQDASLAVK